LRNTILGLLFVAFATPISAQDARVFDEIIVTGNDRFRDGDVLATSGLEVGVPYTESDIVAAVEALEFTGEFRDIRIFSKDTTLTISVDEEPSFQGSLSFGLGYDSDDGVFGALGVKIADAFGGPTDLSLEVTVAEEVTKAAANVSNPRFWGEGRPGGVRASLQEFSYEDALFDFGEAKVGPYLTFGEQPGPVGEVRLNLRATDVDGIDATASDILKAEGGENTTYGLGGSVVFGAAEGSDIPWALRFDLDVYGGDIDYTDARITWSSRVPIFAGTHLRTRGALGSVMGRGGSATTIAERFSIGGSRMRGFARNGISVQDLCAGCGTGGDDIITDLGGQNFAVLQNDLEMPLFGEGSPIMPSVFVDVGSVWDIDADTAPSGVLLDEQEWRSSAGLAVSAKTPLGDLVASYALVTNAEDTDDTAEFNLFFSNEF